MEDQHGRQMNIIAGRSIFHSFFDAISPREKGASHIERKICIENAHIIMLIVWCIRRRVCILLEVSLVDASKLEVYHSLPLFLPTSTKVLVTPRRGIYLLLLTVKTAGDLLTFTRVLPRLLRSSIFATCPEERIVVATRERIVLFFDLLLRKPHKVEPFPSWTIHVLWTRRIVCPYTAGSRRLFCHAHEMSIFQSLTSDYLIGDRGFLWLDPIVLEILGSSYR